jgi:hypothetical protein
VNGIEGSGKWFDDVRVGDTFASALTITETHIVMGAAVGMYSMERPSRISSIVRAFSHRRGPAIH